MLPGLNGPLCQAGTGSPTPATMWGRACGPEGCTCTSSSLLRGWAPCPSPLPADWAQACQHSQAATTASRRARLARACPRSSPSLAGLSGPARSCHNPGPGEAGAGEPGAEPRCWNRTQTEAWKAGFLENFLEPGLVGSHTQGFQAPHRDSETCPASALNLPVRAQNCSLTSGPVHMLFPTHPLVWAAGYHLLQEAFPQAPTRVDGGPFTLGCHCPCPDLHPNHSEPSPGPA